MHVYTHVPSFVLGIGKKLSDFSRYSLLAVGLSAGALFPLKGDTIGGGTISSPAIGPAPSYGLGGANAVLVKNWDFGTGGTIKNNADLSAHFFFHDQFNTISNKYGSKIVSPDAANALPGQPIEGINSPRSEEHTSELQSQSNLVCRLLLEKKKHTQRKYSQWISIRSQGLWTFIPTELSWNC